MDQCSPAFLAAWRGGLWRLSLRSDDAASMESSAPDAEWPPPPLDVLAQLSSSRSAVLAATAVQTPTARHY